MESSRAEASARNIAGQAGLQQVLAVDGEPRITDNRETDSIVETRQTQLKEFEAQNGTISRIRDAVVQFNEEPKDRLPLLLNQRQSLEKEFEAQRDLDSPIRKLPVELLAELFIVHVEAGGEIADIALTCKLWGQIAFRTAKVWSRITIRFSPTYNWISREVSYNRVRFPCRKYSALEQILGRSGSCMLTIDLEFSTVLEAKDHSEAFKILHTLNAGAFLRCVSLIVNSSPGVEWDHNPDFKITFQPFPVLRTLVVEPRWQCRTILSSILRTVEDTSPAFRSLAVLSRFPNSLQGRSRLLERLHDMHFSGRAMAEKTLKPSRNTTALYLRNLVLDLDPDDHNPFPSLQTMSLDWGMLKSLEGRTFPSTTKLEIETQSTEMLEKVEAQFPNLRELSITGPGWQLTQQFSNSAQLTSLRLGDRCQKKTAGDKAIRELWDGSVNQPNPSATHLPLHERSRIRHRPPTTPRPSPALHRHG